MDEPAPSLKIHSGIFPQISQEENTVQLQHPKATFRISLRMQ